MVEQDMVKVYELAKELGMDSISLLDKLNGLNIKVKSHMSELGPDEVRLARTSLSKKGSSDSVKKAPVKTRKKATTVSETSTASATAPAGASAAGAATPATSKSAASTVIRRRGSESAATPTSVTAPQTSAKTSEAPTTGNEEPREASETIQEATPESALNAGSQNVEEESHAKSDKTFSGSAETETPSALNTEQKRVVTEIREEVVALGTGETQISNGLQATGSSMTQATSGTSSTLDSPMQMTPKRAPIILPPRPVAPRRSILKIVEPAAPPSRPMVKPVPTVSPITPRSAVKPGTPGAAGDNKDGFRIIKMTKENLDQMVEEEAAKKRGGGGREAEIRPEDVRFADYRKKEMVFLPKKKKLPMGKQLQKTQLTTPKAAKRVVEMQDTISVGDLANQLNVKATDVVRKMMGMGQMTTINQSLDFDTATLIGTEYGYEVRNVAFKEDKLIEAINQDAAETLLPRPPVVTIMGHVDHGKTSLLDAIRVANVAGGEAGGITQHIGAYTVEQNGKLITFIDTPGHEAFTSMRARGANVTDIVILVVAADDGVMPQTREALSHAQAAGVPIIVAVNKMDKASANPEKIKQGLAELNLLAEDWGGQTMFVPVSAIKKTNLDKLLEAILLQAEVLDLKANPDARAQGTILEARLEKGRGPVGSILVKRGTLRVGDSIVSGVHAGRVKAMTDDKGKAIKELKPGFAAEVLGFESLPNAGERFDSPESENAARKIAGNRLDKSRATVAQGKMSIEDLFSKIQNSNVKELNIVLKGDVFGSVEAVRESLIKNSTEKVKVKVIYSAAGGITESDVLLASASNALIIGFNVRPETKARQLAESSHVEIKNYTIIYELLDDVKKSMAGMLDKKRVEKFLGRAEVRQTFSVPKIGTIAGTSVIDGKIIRGANVRLLRDSRIIFEGKMSSLKRFKDDAKEVATGYECGIGLENYNDLKPGDLIEAYQIEMITPELGA